MSNNYDPDAHRYDSYLGNVPMMQPVVEYNLAHVLSYIFTAPPPMTAPCVQCGRDRRGYRHKDMICRYCAGEAE